MDAEPNHEVVRMQAVFDAEAKRAEKDRRKAKLFGKGKKGKGRR